MAVDTFAKRLSVMHIGLPWRQALPVADGEMTDADRRQLLWLYAGEVEGRPNVNSLLLMGVGR